ncbi:putative transmembrane adaptor Erv26 [Ordospora pajunii]|uniref:putative transmembrane adaptor Erv26 n=1 Tax=Ordospora pajunii TaxID=3039483 RepID=UPI0029525E72|nr:putative transmembrane adaptor Erv26 [Ordospora pajunii]KAH9410562.1 putative transmembrane adaptor Erv26 [Ordospora pajunii]
MISIFFKSLFLILGSVGGILAFGMGIIKAIDYIEDRAYAAKKYIATIVQISMGLHFVFLLRGVSILHILFSLSIQYSFYCLLELYPLVKMDNPYFIYGTIASLINHFLVIRMVFSKSKVYGLEIIFSFALIWITPFCFFLSLSANDEALMIKGKKASPTMIGNILKKYLFKESK